MRRMRHPLFVNGRPQPSQAASMGLIRGVPRQATGEPNSPACGDQKTAWASATTNEQASLTLKYSQAVIPTQINIHQTYSPGSIVRVEVIDAQTGKAIILPNSTDKPGNTPC